MSTEMSTEVPSDVKTDVSVSDMLKSILLTLNDQVGSTKTLMNTIRSVLKDSDKQSKELEKLRNKRSRSKTERSANALPSGITKPVVISDELAKFLNVPVGTLVPRNEVTKGVSNYVKLNDLSDPTNKQRFVLDDRPMAKVLRSILGNPKEDVTYFNLQRYLKHHYIHDPVASVSSVPEVPKKAVDVSSETPPVVVKKKIMVKKKVSELTEEV